jgi:hypothetical protein
LKKEKRKQREKKMGVNVRCMREIKRCFDYVGTELNELKMVELGAQRLVQKTYVNEPDFKSSYSQCNTSKQYFESLGIEHTSLDITGQFGCVDCDLSNIHEKWRGYFDVLTDCGTSEHVRNGQYEVFANAHNFVRKGGVMYHANPVVGRMLKFHTKELSVYYHEYFYKKLAEINGYEVLESKIIKDKPGQPGGLLMAIFKKVNDDSFCSREDFWKINGIKDYSRNGSFTSERLEYEKEEANS